MRYRVLALHGGLVAKMCGCRATLHCKTKESARESWYQSQVPAGSMEFEGRLTKLAKSYGRIGVLGSMDDGTTRTGPQSLHRWPCFLSWIPFDVRVDGVQAEVNLLKRVVSRDEDRALMSKVKAPNLKPFGGARSAKELENFLWDMETYFQVAHILEAEKVSITSIYLTGDVKLRWCTRLSDDASANRDKIETWDVLKKELKDQFLPCNTSWLARESI
ncbi:hypothetical protein Sango_1052900 [Sesamum angolense]|uniref:Uncharacterized protein n=1 Tax=Sesamum angolense TaxID=2727404 RepID=A0AAE1X1L7_9LAMI|nr:hypothetical protein Sango_1052900 [Sesamum angolense]